MPRRPRPVLYREALAALQDAHLTLLTIIANAHRLRDAREQMQLLADRLRLLLGRDNGRSQ